MKKYLSYFFCLLAASVHSANFCYQHAPEIYGAQGHAANILYKAHSAGGELFRATYSRSAPDLAKDQFHCKNTYTQMAAVYREFLGYSKPPGVDILLKGWQDTSSTFMEIYSHCAKEHGHLSAYYQRGRIHFDYGKFEDCVADITTFIQAGGDKDSSFAESRLLHGTVLNETGDYDQAIQELSNLIKTEPNNKEAYYQRAIAYLETGEFEGAKSDYYTSEKIKEVGQKNVSSEQFAKGLLQGLVEGGHEALEELFPSLWYSLRGVSTTLWTVTQTPLKSYNNFVNACSQAVEASVCYMLQQDESLLDEYATEFRALVENFDRLSEHERGRMTGYVIGKYGTDILSGVAVFKGVQTAARLQQANRLCVFEAVTTSEVNAQRVVSNAIRHNTARNEYFSNIKIHWDKQNKHVVGAHNYRLGGSIFEHIDAQELLVRFAGKGKPTRAGYPGTPGYREIIDFGEFIGYHIEKNTGLRTPTTWGEIHYSKTGAHIVPSRPR